MASTTSKTTTTTTTSSSGKRPRPSDAEIPSAKKQKKSAPISSENGSDNENDGDRREAACIESGVLFIDQTQLKANKETLATLVDSIKTTSTQLSAYGARKENYEPLFVFKTEIEKAIGVVVGKSVKNVIEPFKEGKKYSFEMLVPIKNETQIAKGEKQPPKQYKEEQRGVLVVKKCDYSLKCKTIDPNMQTQEPVDIQINGVHLLRLSSEKTKKSLGELFYRKLTDKPSASASAKTQKEKEENLVQPDEEEAEEEGEGEGEEEEEEQQQQQESQA